MIWRAWSLFFSANCKFHVILWRNRPHLRLFDGILVISLLVGNWDELTLFNIVNETTFDSNIRAFSHNLSSRYSFTWIGGLHLFEVHSPIEFKSLTEINRFGSHRTNWSHRGLIIPSSISVSVGSVRKSINSLLHNTISLWHFERIISCSPTWLNSSSIKTQLICCSNTYLFLLFKRNRESV